MKDKDIEAKIDDLAQMVARGFMEIREDMATKEDLVHLRGDIDIMLDRHIGTFRTPICRKASG
jgi:hypothetical protein